MGRRVALEGTLGFPPWRQGIARVETLWVDACPRLLAVTGSMQGALARPNEAGRGAVDKHLAIGYNPTTFPGRGVGWLTVREEHPGFSFPPFL